MDIIEKIKSENLLGRSGSMFSVAKKWEMVKNAKGEKKYVVCNASEGEIETFKDYFILKNYPKTVIDGVKIAMETFSAEKGYVYINKKYYEEISNIMKEFSGNNIEFIKKEGGYVGGEETALIEVIEGNAPEPRKKPPFPSTVGLWGFPTLINNVETFYCVAKIAEGNYKKTRFFSIGRDALNKGVFEFPEKSTIKEILEKTNNVPDFDYFLQVGGGAGGKIILPNEIDEEVCGLGSILIYNKEKTDNYLLMKTWAEFLMDGSCGKCTACREGLYRIMKMIEKKDFSEIEDIFFAMEKTSFCPLGRVAVNPFRGLLNKVILKKNESNN
jgi:NADH:ubiquinone oxidoreductase subunit F (NADH-binding)